MIIPTWLLIIIILTTNSYHSDKTAHYDHWDKSAHYDYSNKTDHQKPTLETTLSGIYIFISTEKGTKPKYRGNIQKKHTKETYLLGKVGA